MSIFDLFRHKKSAKINAIDILTQGLVLKGVSTNTVEIEKIMSQISQNIEPEIILDEQMEHSWSAELKFNGSKYILFLPMRLLDAVGQIRSDIANVIFFLANCYACASEIAKARGHLDLVIKPGQKIALCDFMQVTDHSHPLHTVLSDLGHNTINNLPI